MPEISPMEKVTLEPLPDTENYTMWSIFIREILNRDGLLDHTSDAAEFPTYPSAS